MSIKKYLNRLFFAIKEKTYNGRIKYIYENNNSDELIISFAAFSDSPCYNYYRALRNVASDKLFLQDNFGYKGSYLLYENGSNLPERLTLNLINMILNKKHYHKISTIGTSKGGTCAIYFGLQINANYIYSGANQYYIGKYLNNESHRLILQRMMGGGKTINENQEILDSVMPNLINKFKNSKSHIFILYSKHEHTYLDDIKPMLTDLKNTNIAYTEVIENFHEHNEVGTYFIPFIQKQFNNIKNE